MIKYLQRLKHKKGFTLVEMIVVMAIIAFLSSILIPQFTHYVSLARVTAVNATASTLRKTIQGYMLEMNINGNKGIKRSASNGSTRITVTAQIIWSVSDYNWMVKSECKPCYWNGVKWDNKNAPGLDAKNTCFNDADNWYSDDFKYVGDNVTVNNKNHLMALTVYVKSCIPDLRTGLILACFESGLCKGVIYIPNWDYKWPQSTYPSTYSKGMRNVTARPKIFQSNRWSGGENKGDYVSSECMMEFSPWHGVWPLDADYRTWTDAGIAGIQKDGFYVGTSPAIGYAVQGRRNYSKDWGYYDET